MYTAGMCSSLVKEMATQLQVQPCTGMAVTLQHQQALGATHTTDGVFLTKIHMR
jgi:hypothetical protein